MSGDGTQEPSGPPSSGETPPSWSEPTPYQPPHIPPSPPPTHLGYGYEPPGGQPPAAPFQQPGGYGYPPGMNGYAAAPTTDGMATASLVLGIMSFVCLGPFCSVPGLILGILSRKKIAGSNGRLTGDGQALAGIIISGINLALIAIYIVVVIISFGAAAA